MTGQLPEFSIAVVDDDPRILESMKGLLESADYAVRAFDSAWTLLRSGCIEEIDCLITDIAMPAMNGFELSQVVYAIRPALPVFLISGESNIREPLLSNDAVYRRLFKKPFDGRELLGALTEVLGNPPSRTTTI